MLSVTETKPTEIRFFVQGLLICPPLKHSPCSLHLLNSVIKLIGAEIHKYFFFFLPLLGQAEDLPQRGVGPEILNSQAHHTWFFISLLVMLVPERQGCCCIPSWTNFSFIKGQSNTSPTNATGLQWCKQDWGLLQVQSTGESDTESRARDIHSLSSSMCAPCYVGNSMVSAGSCHKPQNAEDKKPGSGAPERREFPCNRANYSLHCRE